MFQRQMQHLFFSVPPQIGGRNQPAVVVLGGLQSLITVVAVGNEFECLGVRHATSGHLYFVPLLKNGFNKFASMIVKFVPDKVGNFKIFKSPLLDEPAQVRRGNCFLRVKGAAVEGPVQLPVNVLVDIGVVVVVIALTQTHVLFNLTLGVGGNFVGPGGVILNAKTKVVGGLAVLDVRFVAADESDKAVHTAVDNFVDEVFLGPGKLLGGQVKIENIFFGVHQFQQTLVGLAGAASGAVRRHRFAVQVVARRGHCVLENQL